MCLGLTQFAGTKEQVTTRMNSVRGASMEPGGASGASQEKASAADWKRLEWSSRRLGPEVEGALDRLKAP